MSPSTRRRFLRTATAVAVSTAVGGCNRSASSNTGTETETTTTARTAASGTTTAPRALVDVARESYLAKAWTLPQDRYRSPRGDPVPLAELDEPVREAVRAAIDSPPYTTRDASRALLDGIDDVDLVAYGGAVWDVEHTFPTVTVRLDADIAEAEPVADRTVAYDGDVVRSNDAVEDVVSTIASHGVETAPRPHETTRLDPAVREFLDRYGYVETPRGVGEIVVARTNRTPPHTVRAREATDEELYGRRVREVADYGPPTKAFVERVLASDRKTPGNYRDRVHTIYPDDVPRRFAGDLDRGSNYVRVDGEVYGFDTRHVHWNDLPLEFRATVAGETAATAGPVDVRLSVRNAGDRAVRLRMAGPAPFGVLWAYGPGGERVLWNDAYERIETVVVEDGSVVPASDTAVTLHPDRSRSATYRLGHDHLGADEPLRSGTYEVPGTIWARWPTYDGAEEHDWRSQLFPYTLTVEVA
jgi:hypothetical protein